MNREAFGSQLEYDIDVMRDVYMLDSQRQALARIIEQAQAAQQWIPYKDGDVVERGHDYLITYRYGSMLKESAVCQASFQKDEWFGALGEPYSNVTAYRSLPAPFGGE